MTNTIFKIGTAQRYLNDKPPTYTVGTEEFRSLEEAQKQIRMLRSAYESNGIVLGADEFVPVEIATTIHETA
jgi:hypothetical protein